MPQRTGAVAGRRAQKTASPRARGAKGSVQPLVRLLDDDPLRFTVEEWVDRNLHLYEELVARELMDGTLVPEKAHRFLTERLIRADNPAATDRQNAGHVRAQNENVLHYALSLRVPRRVLTIAIEAGFIHDLNKAVGAPLRRDRYAVRNARGELAKELETVAQSVGLNHLGEWTRSTIEEASRLGSGALPREAAEAIDLCIVHHGLGSSMFIRRLLDGDNEWWGDEFVDESTGVRRLVHPPQPPITLQSAIHDLADSTQQMQAGVAWLEKYPAGFWRASGRSYWEMLSGRTDGPIEGIPMSLRQQIEVEAQTCRAIVAEARSAGLIDRTQGGVLDLAITAASKSSSYWIEDDPKYLRNPRGASVYHDLARAFDVTPLEAVELAKRAMPSAAGEEKPAGDERRSIEDVIWASAREVDLRRVKEMARRISRSAPLL